MSNEAAIKKGSCPKCKGKKKIILDKKTRKVVKCPRCQGFGFRVDEIF
jgi:predicted RNA-binding Zn-ribbon protein involved in translation (DUF1610 family)